MTETIDAEREACSAAHPLWERRKRSQMLFAA